MGSAKHAYLSSREESKWTRSSPPPRSHSQRTTRKRITSEERQRMEENRMKALEIRERKSWESLVVQLESLIKESLSGRSNPNGVKIEVGANDLKTILSRSKDLEKENSRLGNDLKTILSRSKNLEQENSRLRNDNRNLKTRIKNYHKSHEM